MPRISVIMPVYNCEKYLNFAINSILNQSFSDFELIIINDGSSDSTQHIIDQATMQDQRIRSFKFVTNLGIASARNLGCSLGRGKYIANMDSDDISYPHRLELQFKFLEKNQHIDVLGSGMEMLVDDQIVKLPKQYLDDTEIKAAFMTLAKNISDPTAMWRKKLWLENPSIRYNAQFTVGEDLDFWLQCMKAKAQFANLADDLVQYRIHHQQITSNTWRMIDSKNLLAKKALSLFYPNLNNEEMMILAMQIAVLQHQPLVIDCDNLAFQQIINKAKAYQQTLFGENRHFLTGFLDHLQSEFLQRKSVHGQ